MGHSQILLSGGRSERRNAAGSLADGAATTPVPASSGGTSTSPKVGMAMMMVGMVVRWIRWMIWIRNFEIFFDDDVDDASPVDGR